jgi:RNA polymerase primary sigma factor
MSRLGESDKHVASSLEDTSRSGWTDLQEQRHRDLLTQFVSRLDRRERFILRSRYALGSHRKKRTCRQLAQRLGVSKERVRQIEKRAIAKIQDMAAAGGLADNQGS